jgi:hypothetical protein
MIHRRTSVPERNEMVALSTGESTATRNRVLIGPCIEVKTPAANMMRTERKRIVGRSSSFYLRCLKAPAFMYFSKAGAFADFV